MGGAYHNVIKPIEIQQKFIIKTLFRMKTSFPTNQLFALTGFLNVRKLYVKNICAYIHKNNDIKRFVRHNYCTRAKLGNKLKNEAMKTTIGQQSFMYNTTKFYNKLPSDIANTKCLHRFKKKLNVWLVNVDDF